MEGFLIMVNKFLRLSLECAILPMVFLLAMLFPRFEDPDFYWHIKMGEYIVSAWPFPRQDIFAYTSYVHQWLLTEWLSQVAIYLIYREEGFNGIAVFVAVMCACCWHVNYSTCKKILNDEGKAIVVTLLFFIFFGIVAPRPHLFTFLFFSLLMRLLVDFKYYKDERYISFIPLIMLIWVNVHGGFFIGIVLMGLFVAAEWIMFFGAGDRCPYDKSRLAKLSFYVTSGVLAAALNPGFFKYWLYPYQVIVSSGDMNIINEWQSPNFHMPMYQYFLLMVFIFFLCLIFSRKKPDLTEIVLPIVFAGGAFVSVRNLPLAALAMSPVFAVFYRELSLVDCFSNKIHNNGGLIEIESNRASKLSSLLATGNKQIGANMFVLNWILLFSSLFAVFIFYQVNHEKKEKAVMSFMPVKAVDFIIENNIYGRVFNAYHYGGYLIYRLHPRQKVFIYGKTDIYKKGFVDEVFAVYSGKPDWKKNFDKYHIDYVVCESVAPIRQLILGGDEYKIVYDDGDHSVLLRDVQKYKSIINKYGKNL